ncbi:MAG: hypothetical protein KDK97_07115 [Verrucomicrobiales bacterium]|nr:hypothetical protein [Verrucomicrobiales bacterium]MCP5557548.1 hypothetical protein [Verrucomicrobiaceae bacterium]
MKPQDPLPPEDDLWKLLGQSRSVDVRPNFVANVVREARQTPQERGFWAQMRGWLTDAFEAPGAGLRVAGLAAVLTIAGVVTGVMLRDSGTDAAAGSAVALQKTTPAVPPTTVAVDPLEHLLGTDWALLTEASVASTPVTDTKVAAATKADKLDARWSALLAIENTSTLSDGELALLVAY